MAGHGLGAAAVAAALDVNYYGYSADDYYSRGMPADFIIKRKRLQMFSDVA